MAGRHHFDRTPVGHVANGPGTDFRLDLVEFLPGAADFRLQDH